MTYKVGDIVTLDDMLKLENEILSQYEMPHPLMSDETWQEWKDTLKRSLLRVKFRIVEL